MPRKSDFKPARRKTKRVPAPPPPDRQVIETYGRPRIERVQQTEPDAFNGMVFVERYRVTIEKIEEPVDVLRARLVDLWETCERNIHLWDPIREKAIKLGCVKDRAEADRIFEPFRQGIRHKKAR